jgi:hypothetical protein
VTRTETSSMPAPFARATLPGRIVFGDGALANVPAELDAPAQHGQCSSSPIMTACWPNTGARVLGTRLRLTWGAIKAFEVDYGAKYLKAVAKVVDDADVLQEFYRYPAEHLIHLRTTNPIESTFATVRLPTKVAKGPGSRAAGIIKPYRLIDAAQARWRAVTPHIWSL